jgi:glycosyltransferase involved in cell wall biosynthesis
LNARQYLPPPKISVILPTWNRLARLKIALDSYRNSNYTFVEFIVIDNNSDDGTWDYLLEIEGIDPRVRPFRNPQNLGPSKTLLRGFCECKSPFIIFMADDDVLKGEYIELCVEIFERYPKVGMVHHFLDGWQAEKKVNKFDIFNSGAEAICEGFMKSGSMPGIAWRLEALRIRDFNMSPRVIYPQVELSIKMLQSWDLGVINSCGLCAVNWGDSVLDVKSIQNRPNDFGIGERMSYLERLSDQFISIKCSIAFSGWAYANFESIFLESPKHAKIFISALNVSLNRMTPEVLIKLFKNGYYYITIKILLENIFSPKVIINYYRWLLYKFKKYK